MRFERLLFPDGRRIFGSASAVCLSASERLLSCGRISCSEIHKSACWICVGRNLLSDRRLYEPHRAVATAQFSDAETLTLRWPAVVVLPGPFCKLRGRPL